MDSPTISLGEIPDSKVIEPVKKSKNIYMFFAQIILIYFVVFAFICQISYGKDEHRELWLVLLSSSLGHILPSPTLSSKRV